MTSTGAQRRDTTASGQATSALYMTALFTVAGLFDRDSLAAVLALAFALAAVALYARHRLLVGRGRFATTANALTTKRASGNVAVLLGAMAVLDNGQSLLHRGRWDGDGPSFLLASVTTAGVAAVVWLLLVLRDRRRRAAQKS